ncbi:MAG: hypothetical protein IAI48_18740 [Candidatus Eremiobacteraeota bacterium]|nr:hypothetical protein [Candidatus Eremiobacteraeota bacterium]
MGFELHVAARRDPSDLRPGSAAGASPSLYTALSLNGTLDDDASRAVVTAVSDLPSEPGHSILVAMEDVAAASSSCLDTFAASMMSLRAAGKNVQVSARHLEFYETLAGAPNSRDWLLNFAATDTSGPRSGLHLDGPGRT